MTGGFAGIMGAIICGPRIGRFTDIRTGVPIEMETHGKDNKIHADSIKKN